jgi:hypothetical protein
LLLRVVGSSPAAKIVKFASQVLGEVFRLKVLKYFGESLRQRAH